MERSKSTFLYYIIKSLMLGAFVLFATSFFSQTVQAQRITTGPSPDLVVDSITRDMTNGKFVLRYCNIGQGLATATMTVSLTNNGNASQAVAVSGQVVPAAGACNTLAFACTSFGTSCYEGRNLKGIVDVLGQIIEVSDANNEKNVILESLPEAMTNMQMTCTRSAANTINVNLSWGGSVYASSYTVQVDDPSTGTNPDVQKTGLNTVTYSFPNNAFAGKTLTGKVWGVNQYGSGPVASFPSVTCPSTLPPPTFTVNAVPVCANELKPTGRYRLDYIVWGPDPATRVYDSYATGTHTITKQLTIPPGGTPIQSLYVALHSETANNQPLNAMQPIGNPPNAAILYQHNWTDQNWNALIPNTVPSGTYTIFYQAPDADCVAQPFKKTGPVSGATFTPGDQTLSWTKYTGAGGFNQYLLTFKNSAGTTVMTRKISDINTTFTSIPLWTSGDNPPSGDTILVKPPFAIGNGYTWQIVASAGGAASAAADNGVAWTFNIGESAGCKPQNLKFTCGVGGDPTKVQATWTNYVRPLRVTFDNLKNTWYTPAYKGDYLFTVPGTSYPQGIASVTATSFIADIETNQDYDLGIHDLATVNTGNLTTCRTDVLLKCPATTAVNCDSYTGSWSVSSVVPTYTNGKVGLTINGSFPHSAECMRRTGIGGVAANTVATYKNPDQTEMKGYAPTASQVTSISDTKVVLPDIFAYTDGSWTAQIFFCKGSTTNGSCINGTVTTIGSILSSAFTITNPASSTCVCKSDNTCDTTCTFDKYTSTDLPNVSYANPIGCSLSSVPYSSAPSQANKNAWCGRRQRTMGDSDGNSSVDSKDYFYYVQAVVGGSLPSDSSNNVNPDFNGNGSVGTEDRIIIIKKLGGV